MSALKAESSYLADLAAEELLRGTFRQQDSSSESSDPISKVPRSKTMRPFMMSV